MKKTAIALAISMASGAAFATGLSNSTDTSGGSTAGWSHNFSGNGFHSRVESVLGNSRSASAFSGASVGAEIVGVTPDLSVAKASASSSNDTYGYAIDGALGMDWCLEIDVQGVGIDATTESDAEGEASLDLAPSHRGNVEFAAAATGGLNVETIDMVTSIEETFENFVTSEQYDEYETSYKTVTDESGLVLCIVCDK